MLLDLTTIREFSIFRTLTDAQLEEIIKRLVEHKYRAKETIFEEGDDGDSMFLMLEGEVIISQALTMNVGNTDVDQREKSLIRLDASAKTFFGEVGLIEPDGKRTATVRAIEDCVFAELKREDFAQLAENDPVLGYSLLSNIAEVLCQRLRTTNKNLLKISTAFSLALERQK